MIKFIRFSIISLLINSALFAAMPTQPPLFSQGEELIINNRILLKINGKPLSVLDVVRKMDLLFYRQFPELADSSAARYQFYTNAWRSMLAAVIDDQLILADAEEKHIAISDGEVREELEKSFGPDVVFNLDRMGLTLQEAFELLKTELTVVRMTNMMVRSKAVTEVHPSLVRDLYEKRLADNPPIDAWQYQVVSIRGETHPEVAAEAHRLLNEQCVPFEEVVSDLRNREGVDISVSETYERKQTDLSLSHLAILQTLNAGSSSAPVVKEDVSRIFCLRGHLEASAPGFNAMAGGLNRELTQEATARHNIEYRSKLRDYYGLSDKYLDSVIPENLQPFALR